MNREQNIKKLTSKVIKTLVFGVVIVVSYVISILGISFDNSVWINIFNMFFVIFITLVIVKIWRNKKSKMVTMLVVVSFICIILTMVYYTYLSIYRAADTFKQKI